MGSFPLSSHTERLSKMIFTPSLLSARHLRDVVESKPASSLVVSLGMTFNETPPIFMWTTGGPDVSEMATPKRVRMFHSKYSDTIHFLVNEG